MRRLSFCRPGQVELVVHDAGLDAGRRGELRELERLVDGLGRGLLGVDRLAGGDGLAQSRRARLRDEEVGVDLPARVGEGRVEVGRVVLDAVLGGELGELGLAAADEDRLDRDLRAVGQLDAALVADREDRADQVLAVSHAARDAVHDDADLAHLGTGGGCRGGAGARVVSVTGFCFRGVGRSTFGRLGKRFPAIVARLSKHTQARSAAPSPLGDRDHGEGRAAESRDDEGHEHPRHDADEHGRGDEEERAGDVGAQRRGNAAQRGAPAGSGCPGAGGGEQRDGDGGEADPADDRDRDAAGECAGVRRGRCRGRAAARAAARPRRRRARRGGPSGSRARTGAAARLRRSGSGAGDGCRRPAPRAA